MPYKERLKTGETRKQPKKQYEPKNWSSYNASLVKRGRISLYFPNGKPSAFLVNQESYVSGVSGRQPVYTKEYAQVLFMLYRFFDLPLRQLTGFAKDYFIGIGLKIDVPSFGHLSALFQQLDIKVKGNCSLAAERAKEGENVSIIVDSTGLSFSMAGAWYEEKYGKRPNKTPWKVMHLAMDSLGDVCAIEMTDTDVSDSAGLDLLLPELEGMTELLADNAYYKKERNEALLAKGVTPVIPPKSNAVVSGDGRWHDKIVSYIKEKGIYAFQNKYGYGKRSLVEAQFSRIKRCIGESLKTRSDSSQKQEGKIIANLLNLWNSFGKANCVQTA